MYLLDIGGGRRLVKVLTSDDVPVGSMPADDPRRRGAVPAGASPAAAVTGADARAPPRPRRHVIKETPIDTTSTSWIDGHVRD